MMSFAASALFAVKNLQQSAQRKARKEIVPNIISCHLFNGNFLVCSKDHRRWSGV